MMPAFTPEFIQFVLLLLFSALYLPMMFYAFQRRDGQEAAVWLTILGTLLALSIGVGEAFWYGGSLPQFDSRLFRELEIYGTLALSFVLILVVFTFLRRVTWWIGFGLGAFWGLGLLFLLTNALHLPEIVWSRGEWVLYRDYLGETWSILGWAAFTIGAIGTLINAAQGTRQPLFRNRLSYWTPIFFLFLVNDFMLFAGFTIPGHPLRLGALALTTYVVCTHHLPDLRRILRRVLVYIITTSLIVGLYIAGFTLSRIYFSAVTNFNPLFVGAVLALMLATIFTPLLGAVRRMVNAWLHADQYDPGQILHQYSESISNILDMERLANVAVGIIIETMQVERGFLFLVDTERDAEGRKTYRLHAVRSPEENQIAAVELDEFGPIASTLTREARPLLQYDLDLLPLYRSTSARERQWFNQLQTEVYLPIFAKKQWIGLLALGSKISGNRYTEEDLMTLSALANQTAVALENARLVDNLMRLNADLRLARRALEKSNRDLERLDQTKSDFISIASHELRTPLTVIKGYTEMLMEDNNLDPNFKQVMKGIRDGTLRLHEVMDSMFDIAQIDARALQLHLQPVELGELIREVCNAQSKAVRERQQSLTLDLPVLPLVRVDPNLLRKLFHHLVNNAIKFTPNNGRIEIAGHTIPAIIDLPGGGVEIIVSDTGVGVDPNFRELIFTKFYQPGEVGRHSTSRTRFKGGGAGLGLALSKGIVEAHGGRIYVESPGYDEINFPGSRFHVILPLGDTGEGGSNKMGEPVKVQI